MTLTVHRFIMGRMFPSGVLRTYIWGGIILGGAYQRKILWQRNIGQTKPVDGVSRLYPLS